MPAASLHAHLPACAEDTPPPSHTANAAHGIRLAAKAEALPQLTQYRLVAVRQHQILLQGLVAPGSSPFQSAEAPSSFATVRTVPIRPLQAGAIPCCKLSSSGGEQP